MKTLKKENCQVDNLQLAEKYRGKTCYYLRWNGKVSEIDKSIQFTVSDNARFYEDDGNIHDNNYYVYFKGKWAEINEDIK